jgi:hypothetical protein
MADMKQCGDGRIHGSHSWEDTGPRQMYHQCRGVREVTSDDLWNPRHDVTGMFWPVKCTRCDHVHDGGKVTVVQRYADCSTWRCPNCQSLIDDRPASWGGSAIPLDRDGREKR